MAPLRVLLADDHELVRSGFRALLEKFEGVEVIGEASDGTEALRLIETLRPNVVLMDISMPGLNGLDVTGLAAKRFTDVRIIVLSIHVQKEYVMQAMRAGAAGYLLKSSRSAELELAVHAVARGEVYLSPAASKHVVSGYLAHSDPEPAPLGRLTHRQREVLTLIASGNSRKQIARQLDLSVKTIDTYRTQIKQQLSIDDNAGLVRFAVSAGLVTTGSG